MKTFVVWLSSFALGFSLAVFLMLLATHAHAQEAAHHHPPEDQAIHERFYSNWMQPDNPTWSCCNNRDCYPTEFKRTDGHWWGKVRGRDQWVQIPDTKIETHRASPDGRNHLCASDSIWPHVYCAIIGGGM